eukprot:756662-Hanusia_phi.AAC.1
MHSKAEKLDERGAESSGQRSHADEWLHENVLGGHLTHGLLSLRGLYQPKEDQGVRHQCG